MLYTIITWVGGVVISLLASIPLYVAEQGEERVAKIMAFMIVVFGMTIAVALIVAVNAAQGAS